MPAFAAPDGTTLTYDAYDPGGARAAVLILPGWSDHAGRYAPVAERLRSAGLAAYVADLRGHGRSGGRRAHLTRFSQLLGDLQAFRRAVAQQRGGRGGGTGTGEALPQVLLGHGFGGLVTLRYLETQPPNAPVAAVVSSPFLAPAAPLPAWKRLIARAGGDLWPSLALRVVPDVHQVSRDASVNKAYAADQAVTRHMTAGAWREIQWAQRAVIADGARIECPVLFLLGGEDRIVDPHLARAFADGLRGSVHVQWYAELYHELLSDPQRERVYDDLLAFLANRGRGQ
jgi:alpha-beta hydrolase superfamily lysophospholipase